MILIALCRYGKIATIMSISRHHAPFRALAAVLGLALIWHTRAAAATLPADFIETTLADHLAAPTTMQLAPDGRIFVCEQAGKVRVIKKGQLLTQPFWQVKVDSDFERGLIGIAFHPNFSVNRWVYFYFTVPQDGETPAHNRIVRVRASSENPDVVEVGSRQLIFDLPNLIAGNHNGGAMEFGLDGKLYVAVGENARPDRAQLQTSLLGKILRLNPNGSIPSDNPFYLTNTGRNRAIWALGLRNPYTIAFKPGRSKLFINDVGEGTWEEINAGRAGANYGWPTFEGPTTATGFDSPLHAYAHEGTGETGCAVIGGAFYNPSTVRFPPSYVNKYFYGDLCGGFIHVLNPATGDVSPFATGIGNLVGVRVGTGGALYYLARNEGALGGVVRRVVYAPAPGASQSDPSIEDF